MVFLCGLWLFIGSLGCNSKKIEPVVAIIPQPKELTIGNGVFTITPSTRLHFDEASKEASEVIQEYLDSITTYRLEVDTLLETNSLSFAIMDHLPEDEYHLQVSSSEVTLKAGSNKALLNGFQSIRQLLLMNQGVNLPKVEIIDRPTFQWRGMLLDCSRHFMEKEFVMKYIDLLALYKMNVLHWHLTDDQGWRMAIDQYPLLTEKGAWRREATNELYGGYYSKEDIRAIVAYAKERGVTVVPEIELPGHSQAALAAYPQFSCTGGPFEVETEWGVFKEIYCAGNDSTYTFLEDVLSEVIELFPSEYIHIGGDEVPKYRWEHCEKCQRKMQEEGMHDEHELQSYFIGRIGRFLQSKGRKMIGWDEISEGGLPEGATVQSWRGYEGAIQAVKLGHQAIVSPTSHAYFDYGLNDIDLEKVYEFYPIPNDLLPVEKALILGGECNMWTERAPQQKVDSKVFPRITAMAETLWAGSDNKNFDAFRERLSEHYPMLDQLQVRYGFETVPVSISTEVIQSKLTASLTSYDSAIQMYIHDGNTVETYTSPVIIQEPTHWTITFGKGNTLFKDTIHQAFRPHLANGRLASVTSPFNDNYAAGGLRGLTDGKKGSQQFRDGNWQGYWGDDIVATIDMGEFVFINEVSSGYLQYNNAWIFFPTDVSYAISDDGENFRLIGTVGNNDSPKNKEQKTQEYMLKLSEKVRTRYIRMHAKNLGVCPDWHDAAGSKAWLFIDEISVQ